MDLSGKLILAWLEEDNEQRALFRVRPLLTAQGVFTPEALETLPDEGYLRIVPDRKEQGTFKDRMRSLGQLCVIDLRGNVEKTRPNKNYAPHRGENNRTVVYSDVILRVPEGVVFEVVSDLEDNAPMTPRFCLRNGGRIQGPMDAGTGAPAGEQAAVAPDSHRLFAVQLPDGREKLFFWPDEAAPQPPVEEPPQEVQHLPVAEQPILLPPVAEEPAPEPRSPRVHIPLHEVVERKRRLRDESADAPVPPPAEALQQALDAMWRAEDTRAQAVRQLAAMPDARALMGRQFSPQMKSAAAAALRQELEGMEADRLRLLLETDRLREDSGKLLQQALDRAGERAHKTIADLEQKQQDVRGRVAAIQAEEQTLLAAREQLLQEIRDAHGVVLARPVGEECTFEEAAQRLHQALQGAGINISEAQAGCLLLLLITCPQVQLDGPSPADSITAARAVAQALGAAVAAFPDEEKDVLLPAGGDGVRVMITRDGGIASEKFLRLIAGCDNMPQDVWREYECNPWPCVPFAAQPGFAAPKEQCYPPVSLDALRAQIPSELPEMPPAAVELLAQVEALFADAGHPLPLAIRQAVARFIPQAQALAGIVAAVDTALATYIVPYARYREMDISALVPLMAGFAQAEAGAE
ncbi:MAG: hypothetical protein ACOX55_05090 [Christensenellales bacterium]|jgi:hypothetical protein